MANPIITKIQIEGNDVVSFLNGTDYVRGMSQILPQNPTYISYRYDSITISQIGGEAFTFSIYTITDVGGLTFTELTIQDSADVVQAKTVEIYRLLVTSIFKGCCPCGDEIPQCAIQYVVGDPEAPAPLLGEFVYASGTPGAIAFNYITGNNQDFTNFFPTVQDGSWIFLFSKTDPTVYAIIQVSNFTDLGTYAKFDAIELNAAGLPFPIGTIFCVDFTSVGGSLVQDWQDTLNISSLLTQDNTVDGGGFDFVFDNNNSFTINGPGGSVEVDVAGPSLNAGSQQILVTSGYIDIITPSYASASTGWVLALTAAGHVEYVEAGTGTISSIELIMPPAFTVSDPNPLTTDGTFTVTVDGTVDQYINGLGELADFPVYTVDNGLHTKESPADPKVFHLGGTLIEDTTITVTNGASEWAFGVSGLAAQDTQVPFGVSNLGQAGVATFQDYAIGSRTNPSVLIVGDNDTWRPLLDLELEGPLPNPGGGIWENHNSFLRLKHTGDTEVGARMAIDYTFRNTSVSPNPDIYLWPAVKLIAEATNVTENSETSNFSIRMFDGGSQQDKMLIEGKGQLTLNEYGTGLFSDGTTNINNSLTYLLGTDNTGKVWKKLATAGGTVQSVSGTGLITTSPNPITTTGTVTTNMATNRLVGRYSPGSGIMQEITIGSGLSLSAGGELTADGSVPVFDGDQGVYKDTSLANDTFMLGAPYGLASAIKFLEERQVDTDVYTLYIEGVISGGFVSVIQNNSDGNGLFVSAPQAYGLDALTDSGRAVNATANDAGSYAVFASNKIGTGTYTYSRDAYALNAVSQDGVPGKFEIGKNSLTASIFDVIQLRATNIDVTGGISIASQLNTIPVSNLITKWTTYNDVSQFEIQTKPSGGAISTNLVVKGTGQLQLNNYTTATSFDPESGPSIGVLNVDNAGNVFVGTGGGGGSYTADNGITPLAPTPPSTTTTFQLGGTLIQDTTILGASYTYDLYFNELDFFDVTAGGKIQITGVDPSDPSLYSQLYAASASAVMRHVEPGVDCTFTAQGSSAIISYSDGLTYSNSVYADGSASGLIHIDSSLAPPGYGIDVKSTGIFIRTPGVYSGSVTNGQVLTLIDAATGQSEWQNGGGGTYTAINGITPVAPTPPSTTTTFKLGGYLTEDTNINGDVNQYSLGFDDMYVIGGTASFKTSFAVNDGTTTSNLSLQAATTDIGCGINGSGSASFAQFTDTQSKFGYLTPTQTVQFGADATGLYVKTPDVASAAATVGQVLTLQNAATGEAEWADASGGGIPFAVASGTDTYSATVSGVTAYTDGDAYLIRFTNGNTDSATLNINSLGAIPLHQNNQVPLIGGDIWNGGEMLCIYNATDNSFECIGTSPNSLFAYVTNVNGSTITRGQAVIAFGGVGNRMTVKLAQANNDANSAQTIGFVFSTSINDNQKGIIIIQGYFSGLSLFPTATWNDGDPVYLSPTTAGAVTKTKPYAPNHLVYLGVVATANNGSAGRMYVRVQNGYELDELHNVQAQSPNLNDTIRYDTADSQWKTASVPSLSGTFSIGVTVDGSGGTITAGVKGYVRVPYACTINTWSILTGNSGLGATITFDIWRANNAIPTAGVSLVGGGTKPFLTSGSSQITSAAPSGWTSVTLAANDILGFNVETGAAVFSWANLQLLVTKI